MSYPDITLIRDICAVLKVSEHELLTASEDTERRASEKLAAKYLRLTQRYRIVQYLLYGGGLPLPHPWSHCKTSLSLCMETVLLLALLLVSDLQYGSGWFLTAALGVLLGLGLFILPVCLRQFPLPVPLNRHKALLYYAAESLLLLLLVAVIFWKNGLALNLPLTLLGLTLPWGLLAVLRYLPANRWLRSGLGLGWSCLWVWLSPWCMDRLILAFYGREQNLDNYHVYQLTAPSAVILPNGAPTGRPISPSWCLPVSLLPPCSWPEWASGSSSRSLPRSHLKTADKNQAIEKRCGS